ncbi:Protein CBG10800 [Caenorhabditis briggsae]|uniref:Protein CBG10800 n=1 Tax=Caenorhabditis briggsae TaxID=6238 RepID=A8XBU0_CAEBR|nr:Protein CBG10800 [Caenorhabditis briggsae]CAP30106.2 Protein CBG10800 [Caenorhabditis briggsae]
MDCRFFVSKQRIQYTYSEFIFIIQQKPIFPGARPSPVQGIVDGTNYTECGYLLEAWNPNIHVLLIDLEFLKQLNYEICQWDKNKRIQIGVNKSYKNLEYSLDKNHFDVIYYTDDSEKDFLKFDIDGGRIIPRRFEASLSGNIAIPKDPQLFYHFWKRSKLLNCANVEMNRTEFQKPVLNASTASTLISRLRDELLDNGMFMFLTDGTLLGWYRECTIIPHTTDLDVSVFKDNYNPIYKKKVLNNESKYFKLWRSLGKAMVQNINSRFPFMIHGVQPNFTIIFSGLAVHRKRNYSYEIIRIIYQFNIFCENYSTNTVQNGGKIIRRLFTHGINREKMGRLSESLRKRKCDSIMLCTRCHN